MDPPNIKKCKNTQKIFEIYFSLFIMWNFGFELKTEEDAVRSKKLQIRKEWESLNKTKCGQNILSRTSSFLIRSTQLIRRIRL